MLRREFLTSIAATAVLAAIAKSPGARLAEAAQTQLGVTLTYDPAYTRIPYPNGDVPRSTGVCADVVIRAARDAFALDLQQLVHQDITRAFAAYPARQLWGQQHPDSNIDHRRVPNLEIFWARANCALWTSTHPTPGDAFPNPLQVGDLLTWRLNANLPHVGIVIARNQYGASILHNVGEGVRQIPLDAFAPHRANGHYRWPAT